MEKKYLEMTKMLNSDVESIQSLIKNRKWIELDEYNKIAAIYDFVRNEILFGYNSSDLPDFNERDFVTKEILFWADTSGSVNQDALEAVYAEIRGIIEQFNGKIKGKLGFFDTDVTPPISFENINELEKIIPYGGGGTDFTVVFHYIKSNMKHNLPSVIIIFTDGYGLFPEEADILDIPVLWLIDNEDVNPPFGKVARLRKAQQ